MTADRSEPTEPCDCGHPRIEHGYGGCWHTDGTPNKLGTPTYCKCVRERNRAKEAT